MWDMGDSISGQPVVLAIKNQEETVGASQFSFPWFLNFPF